MKTGSWNIQVILNSMPQKVATAVADLENNLMGAEYEPIAYLGSQTVNGVNHAVLAKQVIVTGRDSENIVVLIFNEKSNGMTLISVDRILESGGQFGGTEIKVSTTISDELAAIFNDAMAGYVGAVITPYALLGTHLAKGTDYIFAATLSTVALEPETKAVLVSVNTLTKQVHITDMLTNKHEASLNYAFTW